MGNTLVVLVFLSSAYTKSRTLYCVGLVFLGFSLSLPFLLITIIINSTVIFIFVVVIFHFVLIINPS